MTRENRFLKKFFAYIKSWFNSIPEQNPNFNCLNSKFQFFGLGSLDFVTLDFGVCDLEFVIWSLISITLQTALNDGPHASKQTCPSIYGLAAPILDGLLPFGDQDYQIFLAGE